MNIDTSVKAVAQAEDVFNLLEHIAWTETILPKLLAYKEGVERQLIEAVLGQKPQLINGQFLTAEQLAGKVFGINFVVSLLKDILTRGDKALIDLKTAGFTLKDNSTLSY